MSAKAAPPVFPFPGHRTMQQVMADEHFAERREHYRAKKRAYVRASLRRSANA